MKIMQKKAIEFEFYNKKDHIVICESVANFFIYTSSIYIKS
jgi:hypothetical protein